jgi:type II secretory pathway component PulF
MNWMRAIARWFALMEFRLRRAEFYRDFAEMYQRNEAMVSFLEGEIANANLTRQRSRARALRIVLHRHQDGEHASRVSHLLEGVVPRSDAMLLAAVDRAADKPQALNALADAIDKQQQMLRLMVSYSALPAMTIPICYALIVVLGKVILVIDDATPVYAQEALWEGMNGWAKTVAIFAQAWGTQTVLLLGVVLAAMLWSLPHWRGPVRLYVETWPVYSLYRDFQAGMLFSSMAMMLKTGETLQGSIDDLTRRASPWMRWHLGRIVDALDENPTATLDAFRRGLLSAHLLSRAATLNRSSASFSDVLIQLGTSEGERVLARVRNAAVVANFALVGLFASVATFMGVASMTVPGKFATLMEPSNLMTLRAIYDAEHPVR